MGRGTLGRYEDRGLLGEGASGQVRRVWDATLGRALAMKVLRPELAALPRAVAVFEAEARTLAGLQHPGVVPIHEVGRLPDGRPYYTMKEVHGRTLRDVLRDVHAASRGGTWESAGGFAPRRLLEACHRAAETVAYAHACGIVHRDLKPTNVMLGAFGEVLVLDWGLAQRIARPVAPPDADLERHADAAPPRTSTVQGTAVYMPPELARGDGALPDARSDVYSLGATLYEVLGGQPPYQGASSWAVLVQVNTRPPEPLRALAARLGGPPVPEELLALVEKAMAREPAERFPDAGALAASLAAWLDGARRRDEALLFVAQADELEPRARALRERCEALLAAAAEAKKAIGPAEPVEAKLPVWDQEDEAARLAQEARQLETERLQALRAALTRAPEMPEAHARLADHYQLRHAAAEAARDRVGAIEYETLLRAHDRGRHAAWLRGEGALTLLTDPPGAHARLHRYVERQRRLVPELVRELGPTPIVELPLPVGSWLVTLHVPGRPEVRYPVDIGRLEHWDGVPPEGGGPLPVPIPAALDPDDVYIPPGWYWSGGDPVVGVPPRRRLWVDPLVFRRYPTTQHDWLVFLNTLVAEGREEEALLHVPRERSGAGGAGAVLYARAADGTFELAPDADGAPLVPDQPIAMIDWRNAMAFAAWTATVTGLPWRLPGELEWEKAGRGVDGRLLPWGDFLDPTWACCFESHTGPHRAPAPVTAYPADESPYGVRHMAGNMRSWTGDLHRLEGPPTPGGRVLPPEALGDTRDQPGTRVWRGGGFLDYGRALRLTGRTSGPASDRFSRLGCRLARSWTG